MQVYSVRVSSSYSNRFRTLICEAPDEDTAIRAAAPLPEDEVTVSPGGFFDHLVVRIQGKSCSPRDRTIFFKGLKNAVQRKVPISEAINLQVGSLTSAHLRVVLSMVVVRLTQDAYKLAEALGEHPELFDRGMVACIAGGELAGTLPQTLDSLAQSSQKQYLLTKKLKGHLLYFLGMSSLMMLVAMVLAWTLIPATERLYHDMNAQLPWYTLFIFAATKLLLAVPPLALIILGFPFLIVQQWPKIWKTQTAQRLAISLPIVGSALRYASVGRAFQMLAMLSKAGVGASESFALAGEAATHYSFQELFSNVQQSLATGNPLWRCFSVNINDALGSADAAIIINSLKTAEHVGTLNEAYSGLAQDYDERLQDIIAVAGDLVKPVMMIVLAVPLTGLMAIVYLPSVQLAASLPHMH